MHGGPAIYNIFTVRRGWMRKQACFPCQLIAYLFTQSDIGSLLQLDQRVYHLLVLVRVHVGQLVLEKPLEERFNPLVQMLRCEFTRLKFNNVK